MLLREVQVSVGLHNVLYFRGNCLTGFVLYAPNVHHGGGVVLLRSLLLEWPTPLRLTAFLDDRVRAQLPLPHTVKVYWVRASISSRLKAELNLRRAAGTGGAVLCFHGLPPLLPSPARVLVFLQNRLFLENISLSHFKLKTRVRLIAERLISRTFHHRVSEYIVQTPAMQRKVLQRFGTELGRRTPPVRVLPFVDTISEPPFYIRAQPEWDFVYVADGEAHKNHRNLLAAWHLLAQDGLYPSLALTLSKYDEALKNEMENVSEQHSLHISNLGQLPRGEVVALYTKANALIFPSTLESFGLPLIEATQAGLPIIAPELDYVRDVCVPVQTFDPNSPVSIARAVKRFLGKPEPTVKLNTPGEFWRAVLEET